MGREAFFCPLLGGGRPGGGQVRVSLLTLIAEMTECGREVDLKFTSDPSTSQNKPRPPARCSHIGSTLFGSWPANKSSIEGCETGGSARRAGGLAFCSGSR